MEPKYKIPETETPDASQDTQIKASVDGYFATGKLDFPPQASPEMQARIRGKINERYNHIQNLKAHPKTIEYAKRILDGENIQIESLSANTGYAIRYLVAEIQKQRNEEETKATEDLTGATIEQLYQQIPTRYRNLDVESIRDIWVEPIRVDDPTFGRDFCFRKKHILGLIEEQQNREQRQKEIEKKRREVVDEMSGIKPAEVRTETVTSVEAEVGLEVELNKKIELDPNITRISKQEVFGDSNGSYTSFVEHLQSRKLIKVENDGSIVWEGGNTKVVFLGDILGDRAPEGEKIYTELVKLKKAARKSGGDVSWLAGNHENMFNAVLFGFTSENGTDVTKDMQDRLTSYVGNLEMVKYLSDEVIKNYFEQEGVSNLVQELINGTSEIHQALEKRKKIYDMLKLNPQANKDRVKSYGLAIADQENAIKRFQDAYNNPSMSWQEKISAFVNLGDGLPNYALTRLGQEVLNNRSVIIEGIRKNNPDLLEGICEQNLVIVENDVLSCHTNFTKNMITLIEGQMASGDDFKKGVDKLNKFYQNILKWYASPEPRNPVQLGEEQIKYFNVIRDEFISTSKRSRINYTEDPTLSSEDKHAITARLKKYGINMVLHGHNDEDGEVKGNSDVPILSLDRGTHKGFQGSTNRPIAVASVNTSGTLSYC